MCNSCKSPCGARGSCDPDAWRDDFLAKQQKGIKFQYRATVTDPWEDIVGGVNFTLEKFRYREKPVVAPAVVDEAPKPFVDEVDKAQRHLAAVLAHSKGKKLQGWDFGYFRWVNLHFAAEPKIGGHYREVPPKPTTVLGKFEEVLAENVRQFPTLSPERCGLGVVTSAKFNLRHSDLEELVRLARIGEKHQ